jgi:hypothetical protein
MKQSEVRIGAEYLAVISGRLVRVKVHASYEYSSRTQTRLGYEIENLVTGRRLRFRSAMRLRPLPIRDERVLVTVRWDDGTREDHTIIKTEKTVPGGFLWKQSRNDMKRGEIIAVQPAN